MVMSEVHHGRTRRRPLSIADGSADPCLAAQIWRRATQDYPLTDVFHKEGEENTRHGYCCRCWLIVECGKTGIGEHEFCMGEELQELDVLSRIHGVVLEDRDLTWMNAVAMMTPVPNCLTAVNVMPLTFALENRSSSMGPKTPMPLVTRITNRVPIRSGIL